MNKPPPAANFKPSLFVLLAAFFAVSLYSCSEDPVAAASVQAHLILDWEDDQSLPVERLSVFIETSSNVRRVESFLVKSGDYTWNVDSPIAFQSGDRQWVGWPHLEPPPGAARPLFPLGNYQVECVDAAGKKDTATFSIVINAALLDAQAVQVENLISAPQKRIAVYSDSNELLYFDTAKNNWIGDTAIFSSVKDSSYYRTSIAAGSALCFLPKKFKEAKEQETKDGEQSDGLE
ncbi:MAG: hypothetical protein IK015_12600 [Treponema sp.]|nr:hypothetical protein [Treponema sp.]